MLIRLWDTVLAVKHWRSGGDKSARRVGGAQKRPGQERQLAHDGGDDHLGPLALGCEGAELRQQSGCSLVHVMQTAQHWP